MPSPPKTRHARSGDINVAYQVVGDGPLDVVFFSGWISHLDLAWEDPVPSLLYERLASFSRLILCDAWAATPACAEAMAESRRSSRPCRPQVLP